MRLEKVTLVIVVIVALIVTAVPFWRGLALSQLRQTMPCRAETVWIGNTYASIPSPHPRSDAQLLAERPRDFLLRVAVTQELLNTYPPRSAGIGKRVNESTDALLRDFPNQGAAYVMAMDAPQFSNVDVPLRMESWGVDPKEAAENWRLRSPVLPTKKQIDGCLRCIALLDRAIEADPGNGWFHLSKANFLLGLHRDTEALSEIHQAAIAPRFTDYAGLRAKAWDHLCDLRGRFDPLARSVAQCVISFTYFARARDTARIAGNLAAAQIGRGHTAEGVRQVLDITGSGHSMCKHAPAFIHALVGKAMLAIGAAALDPTFASKVKDPRAQQAARLVQYKRFLTDHGYDKEAALLSSQWGQTDRMVKAIRGYFYTDSDSALNAIVRFPVAFQIATGIIAILLISGALWAGASLLTRRGGGRSFWDKRAGVTSALLSTLILAPMVIQLAQAVEPGWARALLWDDLPNVHLLTPTWLLIPAAAIVVSLCVGLAMMLMRAPREGENRKMPVWSLLTAWTATFVGLTYLTNGLSDFAESSRFFEKLNLLGPAITILIPVVALLLYAIIRALQSRFGRVRRSAPLTFVATLRYGSALAVALFAVSYLCLMAYTAHLGAQADAFAGGSYDSEAAVIQSAFK